MLRKCCCCFSLKTGTIIIGLLNILGGVGNIIGGITTALEQDAGTDNVFFIGGIMLAVLGAILVIFSICLIIGAVKGKPALLVPWMVYTIVFLIGNTIIFIYQAVEYFLIYDETHGAASIVAAVIYFLLQTYFLLVVYSLYRELHDYV